MSDMAKNCLSGFLGPKTDSVDVSPPHSSAIGR